MACIMVTNIAPSESSETSETPTVSDFMAFINDSHDVRQSHDDQSHDGQPDEKTRKRAKTEQDEEEKKEQEKQCLLEKAPQKRSTVVVVKSKKTAKKETTPSDNVADGHVDGRADVRAHAHAETSALNKKKKQHTTTTRKTATTTRMEKKKKTTTTTTRRRLGTSIGTNFGTNFGTTVSMRSVSATGKRTNVPHFEFSMNPDMLTWPTRVVAIRRKELDYAAIARENNTAVISVNVTATGYLPNICNPMRIRDLVPPIPSGFTGLFLHPTFLGPVFVPENQPGCPPSGTAKNVHAAWEFSKSLPSIDIETHTRRALVGYNNPGRVPPLLSSATLSRKSSSSSSSSHVTVTNKRRRKHNSDDDETTTMEEDDDDEDVEEEEPFWYCGDDTKLNYREAMEEIFIPMYAAAVRRFQPGMYDWLKQCRDNGCIIILSDEEAWDHVGHKMTVMDTIDAYPKCRTSHAHVLSMMLDGLC